MFVHIKIMSDDNTRHVQRIMDSPTEEMVLEAYKQLRDLMAPPDSTPSFPTYVMLRDKLEALEREIATLRANAGPNPAAEHRTIPVFTMRGLGACL